jgi:hypothetical protein
LPFFGVISGWPEVQLRELGRSHTVPLLELELLLEEELDELLDELELLPDTLPKLI